MTSVINKMQLQKMQRAYRTAFENLLLVKPDLELTQKAALDEDFMRRFFAHIEMYGVAKADLDSLHFRITAAQLEISNSPIGWENFFKGKNNRSLL